MNMISSLVKARLAGKMQDNEIEGQLMFVSSLYLFFILN